MSEETERRLLDEREVAELLAQDRLWRQTRKQGIRFSLGARCVRGLDVSGEDFSATRFENARLERCRFVGTDLNRSDFGEHTGAVDCVFSRSILVKAMISDSDFSGCRFDAANAIRVECDEVVLRGASFRDADLRGALFVLCDLRDAVFDGANLDTTDFINCRVEGMTWAGATAPPVFRTDDRFQPMVDPPRSAGG